MQFEYEIDPQTIMLCEIDEIDDSFDHEFGMEKRVSYEIKKYMIVCCIDNTNFVLNNFFESEEPHYLKLLKERALNRYMEIIS